MNTKVEYAENDLLENNFSSLSLSHAQFLPLSSRMSPMIGEHYWYVLKPV